MKKIISLLLCVAVGVSAFVFPVSAATENTTYIYTFDNYVSETANAAVPNNWVEVNGYSNGSSNNRVNISSAKGVFGKGGNDTVYKINPYYNTDGNPTSQWYQTRYQPQAQINNKKYVRISYEMAVDNPDAERWFALAFKDGSNTTKETGRLFQIVRNDDANPTGSVLKVAGEASDYPVTYQKWMRFDVVCDMEALTANLYVDGNLKKENASLGLESGFAPTVLELYEFGVNQQKRAGGSAFLGTDTFLDNVSYTMTDTKDITEYTYTFDGYTSTAYDLPTGWSEVNGYSNDTSYNRIKVLSAKGVFGKDGEDTAYEIAPEWHTNDTNARWYQTRYQPQAYLGNKRYVKVSYEMAVNLTDVHRWFQISFKDIANTEKSTPELFEIKKENGVCVLYVGKEKSNYAVPAEKWMRFDAVCDMTSRTADLYVDGELIKENVSLNLPEDYVPVTLSQYVYGINIIKNDAGKAYNPSQTYFDNVSYMMTDIKPEMTAYSAPDVIDFQNYESGTTPKAYNAKTKANEDFAIVSPSDRQSFVGYDGLMGKVTKDRSLQIKALSGKVANGDSNAPQWTQYRWNTNTAIDTSSTPYFRFSTEFAMEGASINRGIYLQTSDAKGATECPIIEIYLDNGKQVVKVAGQATELELPMSVLMKFDVVMDRAAKIFDLYINGEKKFENQTINAGYIGTVDQIHLYSKQIWQSTSERVWLGQVVPWNAYAASDTYYDNMDCGKYYTYPTIKKYTSPTVQAMKSYETTVAPIDGIQTYTHPVQLCGHDSEYYYYSQNVTMPSDNATRAYKATLISHEYENVTTEKNIFEVKNGALKAFDTELGNVVPTDRAFKLSFLFDIVNKTYNAYIDDTAVVVEMPFGMTDTSVCGFSNIQSYVTADGQSAAVKETPIEAGAYIYIPKAAQYEPYTVTDGEDSVTVKLLSDKLSGIPILAVYDAEHTVLQNIAVGEENQKEISINKTDGSKIRFMLWRNLEDMEPIIDSFDVN